MRDLTQDEVNNIYKLAINYLKKKKDKVLPSTYDKLTTGDKFLALLYSKLLKERAEVIEPEITKDLCEIESDIGVLKGLEHRVKPFSSILDKVISDSLDYAGSFKKAAMHINDYVRYTFVIPDEVYVFKIDECLQKLSDMGYIVIDLKNNWNNEKFKGIHVRFAAKNNDDVFEIQFHTPLAYRIKEGENIYSQENSTRVLYKVSTDKEAPEWLRLQVDNLRIYLQKFINVPEGALGYKYDREVKRRK